MSKAETCRSWLEERIGCPYIYGATGQTCTVSYRQARIKQYPACASAITKNCPQLAGKATSCTGCKWAADGIGRKAYDCAQLVRWCMANVGITLKSGATSQWKNTVWASKGTIDSLPDKLCIIFRADSSSVMGHVGISLGDGYVIHASSHNTGVIRTAISSGKWTHWGIPVGLYDEEIDGMNYKVTGTKLALRAEPSTSAKVLTRLENGAIVTALDTEAAGWILVRFGAYQGYCMSKYLAAVEEAENASETQETSKAEQLREIAATLTEIANSLDGGGNA